MINITKIVEHLIVLAQRYQKQVPEHHVQINVKFLFLKIRMKNRSNAINIPLLMMQLELVH